MKFDLNNKKHLKELKSAGVIGKTRDVIIDKDVVYADSCVNDAKVTAISFGGATINFYEYRVIK